MFLQHTVTIFPKPVLANGILTVLVKGYLLFADDPQSCKSNCKKNTVVRFRGPFKKYKQTHCRHATMQIAELCFVSVRFGHCHPTHHLLVQFRHLWSDWDTDVHWKKVNANVRVSQMEISMTQHERSPHITVYIFADCHQLLPLFIRTDINQPRLKHHPQQ